MKNIMWNYFTANNTQKYIDVLPSMVETYNNTYHRSIKLTPSDARNPASYQHVHNALYAKAMLVIKYVYQERKVRLRKDLLPIGQKRCLPLAV